jgi:hypothetical protein
MFVGSYVFTGGPFGSDRQVRKEPEDSSAARRGSFGPFRRGDTLAAVSVSVNAQARRRVGFVLVAIAAAGAVGIATWQMLTGRPIGAGLGALAAGAILLAADPMTLGPGASLERTVASYVDRAYDGAILAAIAWAYRGTDPWIAVGALVALGASFLASYVRARGASLGYGVGESSITRGLRYGLISAGLLVDGLGLALWTLASVMGLAALVRTSQVAKEERV